MKVIKIISLALILVFGIVLISCDDGSISNGSGGGTQNNGSENQNNGNGDGNGEESDDEWINITSFTQVDGTWKYTDSETIIDGSITINQETEKIYAFNANAKTATLSFNNKQTVSGSGSDLDDYWNEMKFFYTYEEGTHTDEYETYTVAVENSNGNTIYTITNDIGFAIITINDSTHKITQEASFFSTIIDENIVEFFSGIQISKNGTKLRIYYYGGIDIYDDEGNVIGREESYSEIYIKQ